MLGSGAVVLSETDAATGIDEDAFAVQRADQRPGCRLSLPLGRRCRGRETNCKGAAAHTGKTSGKVAPTTSPTLGDQVTAVRATWM
ncbi:MAG: hypothetical protein R3E79_39955 [Caldilineaceae bacterium]